MRSRSAFRVTVVILGITLTVIAWRVPAEASGSMTTDVQIDVQIDAQLGESM